MDNGVETVSLSQFRWMLVVSGLWLEAGSPHWLGFLHRFRFLAYMLTVALWDWALSRVPLPEIPRKPYTPIVIWSNFHSVTVLFIISRSDDVSSFIAGMCSLHRKHTAPGEVALFHRLTSNTWKWLKLAFGHVILLTAILSLLPTVVDILFLIFSESDEPFYVPTVLESFLPNTTSRSFFFYLFNISNGFLVILPSVYYVGLISALMASVTYIYYELEVFKRKMCDWANMKNKKDPKRKDILKEVVQDHAELLRSFNKIKIVLGTAFSTQNFVSSVNTGFLLHEAKKAWEERDIMLIAQQAYFFSQLVGVTFLCCYIGEILYQKGWEVSQSIFELPFDEETPATRRDLLMILIATQRPIVFDFKEKVPLNLGTFSEYMNRAYTIFILLESFK